MNMLILIGAGILTGVLSGLIGIGGGSIVVPILIYLFKCDAKVAIGTSLCVIFPTALIGSVLHYQAGNIRLQYLVLYVPLSIMGAFLGVKLAAVLPGYVLRKVFAVVLGIVAVKMFLSK